MARWPTGIPIVGRVAWSSQVGELTCREFAKFLRSREAHYPISDRYISEIHDSPNKSGEDEREHMMIAPNSKPSDTLGGFQPFPQPTGWVQSPPAVESVENRSARSRHLMDFSP